ncbi:hypothetical protein C8F04DRAFT_1189433 [Mycena alexandri]|uniref:Uncharacterized protein n=1 Tax=Mycena alexandri TaxID=1745969 RepID=A0AAD6X0C5_9AGAR|nr:hypothetical protein C8F04DRAFT_1189433 [Mycena alexandri]
MAQYRARKLRKSVRQKLDPTKDPWAVLLAKLSGVKVPPRRAKAISKDLRGSNTQTQKDPKADFRAVVARDMFAELPEAQREGYQQRAKQEAAEARTAYEAAMRQGRPKRRKTDKADGLALGNDDGWSDAEVRRGLRTLYVSYGRSKTVGGEHFPDWAAERIISLKKTLGKTDLNLSRAGYRGGEAHEPFEQRPLHDHDGNKSDDDEEDEDDDEEDSGSDSSSDSNQTRKTKPPWRTRTYKPAPTTTPTAPTPTATHTPAPTPAPTTTPTAPTSHCDAYSRRWRTRTYNTGTDDYCPHSRRRAPASTPAPTPTPTAPISHPRRPLLLRRPLPQAAHPQSMPGAPAPTTTPTPTTVNGTSGAGRGRGKGRKGKKAAELTFGGIEMPDKRASVDTGERVVALVHTEMAFGFDQETYGTLPGELRPQAVSKWIGVGPNTNEQNSRRRGYCAPKWRTRDRTGNWKMGGDTEYGGDEEWGYPRPTWTKRVPECRRGTLLLGSARISLRGVEGAVGGGRFRM